jgi:spore coat polysaccharide biosynthesis predicted glycosyltransferase SpsG
LDKIENIKNLIASLTQIKEDANLTNVLSVKDNDGNIISEGSQIIEVFIENLQSLESLLASNTAKVGKYLDANGVEQWYSTGLIKEMVYNGIILETSQGLNLLNKITNEYNNGKNKEVFQYILH